MKTTFKFLPALILVLAAAGSQAQTTANFTANQVCEGASTVFTSNATSTNGNIVLYEWDFQDDGVYDAVGANASFIYPGAGVYNVRHRITTDQSFVATSTQTITVSPNPTVAFAFTGSCVGDTIQFNGSAAVSTGFIQSYAWDFDGSGLFQGATTTQSRFFFPGAGFFPVRLRVVTNEGCAKDTMRVVTLTNKPVASFEVDNVCFGDSTRFSNNSNVSTSILTYSWAFGDGNNATDFNPAHLFNQFGAYNVTLVATSASGCVDSVTKTVEVLPQPTAAFSATTVCFGETTTFTNNATPNGGSFTSYVWNLGDGNVAINLNDEFTYNYSQAGTYNSSLIVRTARGCADTASATVVVNEVPVYDVLNNGPTSFCEGGSVDLSVNAPSNINLLWSTGQNTDTINVATSGNYAVLLFTSAGCQYRDTMEVTVNQPAVLTTSNDTTINNGDEIMLQVAGAMSYTWTAGDLEIAYTGDRLPVSPNQNQTYRVDAINEFGCASFAQVSVAVVDNFNLVPVNLFTPDGNGQNDFWVVQNIDRYPQCEVTIYDSWGVELLNTTSYANDWDGTKAGEKLPEGTYYYRIACPGMNNDLNGFTTILRINE